MRDNFIFDSSLVLYLPLYQLDGASFMSRDAYGHLCTVTGATWGIQGRIFDGTDDLINCGNKTIFDLDTYATILMWIKSDAAIAEYDTFIGRESSTTAGAKWMFWYRNGTISVTIHDGTTSDEVYSSAWTPSTTNFEQICFTKSGNDYAFYLNGQSHGTDIATVSTVAVNYQLYIGAAKERLYFPGIIGEVCFYARQLSPQEIQHNYEATKWRYI